MHKRMAMGLAGSLAIAGAVLAGKPPAGAPIPNVMTKDVGFTVPRAIVEKQVTKLTDKVDWLSSLEEAKQLAKKDNRPIFWVHALGDINGDC